MKNIVIKNFSGSRVPKNFILKFFENYRRHLLKKLTGTRKERVRNAQEIVLVFTTDKKIRELNLKYRRRNYVTDILSFDSEDAGSLGELVISPSQIKKQARGHQLSYHDELSYMLIHGVLHLLGYDHEKSKKAAKQMFEIQDEAFENLSRR